MSLVTCALILVKIEGQGRPAVQLVFLRAVIGVLLIAPLAWARRREFARMRTPWRNAGRVICNAVALTLNFTAVTMMPLAMVNAIGFTRPLVAMGLAVLLLGEGLRRGHWAGAAMALAGVGCLTVPGATGLGPLPAAGLAAAAGSVLFGAMAAIQTRALRGEPMVVMMAFYTVGLTLLTALPAALVWQPVESYDLLLLLGIGVLTQAGQYCFLRAYRETEAGILAPLGYLSILFTAGAGWIVFGERPSAGFWLGSAVVMAGVWTLWRAGAPRPGRDANR